MLEGGLRDLLNMNRRQDQQKTTEQEAMPKKGQQLKILENTCRRYFSPIYPRGRLPQISMGRQTENCSFWAKQVAWVFKEQLEPKTGHNLIMGKMLNELSRIEIKHTFNAILPLPYYPKA